MQINQKWQMKKKKNQNIVRNLIQQIEITINKIILKMKKIITILVILTVITIIILITKKNKV